MTAQEPTQSATGFAGDVAPSDAATWEKVLGWVAEQVRSGELDAGHVIRRVWALTSTAHPSEKLYLAFVGLEDEFACARDGVYGSLPQVRDHLLEVLDDLGRPGALAHGSAELTGAGNAR